MEEAASSVSDRQPAEAQVERIGRVAVPPNLIPDRMSDKNEQWYSDQIEAQEVHTRAVAKRAAISAANNPKNRRAR